jgi:hypothetical protein
MHCIEAFNTSEESGSCIDECNATEESGSCIEEFNGIHVLKNSMVLAKTAP